MGSELTALLENLDGGDRNALDRAFVLVYDELKRLAHAQRIRASGGTLSTTALVHETYLKFLRADSVSAGSREHFYRLASRAMRQILLDRARIAAADKRPASAARMSLDDALRLVDDVIGVDREDLIDIDRALVVLEGLDARLAEVAQLHLFAGLEFQEIAGLRGVSERTVLRDWRKARAILVSQLEPPATP